MFLVLAYSLSHPNHYSISMTTRMLCYHYITFVTRIYVGLILRLHVTVTITATSTLHALHHHRDATKVTLLITSLTRLHCLPTLWRGVISHFKPHPILFGVLSTCISYVLTLKQHSSNLTFGLNIFYSSRK